MGVEKWVAVKDLSARMQMERSACLKLLRRRGVKTEKRRVPGSNHQLAVVVAEDQARELVKERAAEGE